MRNQRLLDMESVDSRLLGLLGVGFGLVLAVAVAGTSSRAHAVAPSPEAALAARTTAPVAHEERVPAVDRHNEVARADMPVIRLEPVVIVATRSDIAAARAAQRNAHASVAAGAIAANVAVAR